MPPLPRTYLGDGVYASFDGYQIWLETEREEGTHQIALDVHTYKALVEYAAKKEKKP